MKFTELKLDKNLMKGIEDTGFSTLMPVQKETFVYSLKGKDVTVQSQTGTGKTAAFLITIFQHFLDETVKRPKRAMILAPTRELAVQIEKDAKQLGKYINFTVGCFYGGVGYHQQERMLEKEVNIIIGTPGRLLDFYSQGKLDFRKIGYLVIDEADRMFDMGFYPDIARILRSAPPPSMRQTMLFSATLDVNTRRIARELMNNPSKVEIMPEQVTVDKITQRLYHVARNEKLNLMLGILKKEMPNNALIFTNTKHAAAQVAKHLEYNGYKCLHLSGDLPQNKRLQVIENFKEGKLPFLVATDVAARGLHIEGLEMIFNYDLPGDCENYVHRIGRTARAGKSGIAISLACEDYVYNLEAIENFIGMKIPVSYAVDDLFEESKSEGMVFDVKKRGGGGGGDKKTRKKTPHHPKPGNRGNRSQKSTAPSKQGKQQYKKKWEQDKKESAPPTTKPPRDKKHKSDKKKQPTKPVVSKERKDTVEDRLEYYQKKYGDTFKIKREPSTHDVKTAPTPKRSFLKRLKDVFGKK
jgi:ATP-dependent RNA helicase RhlB